MYWVLPGGGVEPGDASREHALRREIREEIAGEADITRLVHTLEGGQEHQFVYLANISTWSFDDRTGPEFTQEGRGEYHLDEIPFTEAALDELSIMPPQLVPVLRKLAAAESARVTERTCQP